MKPPWGWFSTATASFQPRSATNACARSTSARASSAVPVRGRRVVSLLCGGNLDLGALPQLLALAQTAG